MSYSPPPLPDPAPYPVGSLIPIGHAMYERITPGWLCTRLKSIAGIEAAAEYLSYLEHPGEYVIYDLRRVEWRVNFNTRPRCDDRRRADFELSYAGQLEYKSLALLGWSHRRLARPHSVEHLRRIGVLPSAEQVEQFYARRYQ